MHLLCCHPCWVISASASMEHLLLGHPLLWIIRTQTRNHSKKIPAILHDSPAIISLISMHFRSPGAVFLRQLTRIYQNPVQFYNILNCSVLHLHALFTMTSCRRCVPIQDKDSLTAFH